MGGPAGAISSGGGKDPAAKPKKRVKGGEANRISLLAVEELSWGDAAAVLNLPGAGLGGPPVQITGTAEQREGC